MKSIPIKEFARKVICDGHLYLRTQEGRRFYLMKPGVLIDPDFIKKHATLNTVFDFDEVVNREVVDTFSKLFKELRYLQFEKDLKLKSGEIVNLFQTVYSKDEHFLSFALACYNEFCQHSADSIQKMHDTDLHLFRKTLYSSAFAVITALSNDYFHYLILRDFYNITMSLDIGLCETNYSYFVSEACNQENQNPGSGLSWMRNENASDLEIQVFLGHPERSYEFIKNNSSILSYPELVEVVLYQHELSDGKGFPRGISKGMVSSWEAVVMLADALVEIKDKYEFETRVIDYIENFRNKKLADIPVQKVFQKLCLGLDHFKQRTGS